MDIGFISVLQNACTTGNSNTLVFNSSKTIHVSDDKYVSQLQYPGFFAENWGGGGGDNRYVPVLI